MKEKHIKKDNIKSKKNSKDKTESSLNDNNKNHFKLEKESKKNYNNFVYILYSIVIVLVIVLLILIVVNYYNNSVSKNTNLNTNLTENNVNNSLDYVAVVNGDKISKESFDKTFDLLLFFQGIPSSYKDKVSEKAYLNQSIEQDLIYDQLKDSNYLVSNDEARKQLESVLEKSNRNIDDFKKTIENKSFSYEDIISQFAKQLSINSYLNATILSKINVSEEEELNYFNQNQNQFTQEEKIRVSHILVNNSDLANQIIDKLNLGGNFSELAKEYSIGPSGKNGGDLGYFGKSQMVPEFETAAFNLKTIGNYTKTPVKTKFGYHVIILTGTQSARNLTFEEVKSSIYENLMKEKQKNAIKSYIDNLLKNNNIKILI